MSHPDERTSATMSYPQALSQTQQQLVSSILLLVIGYYAVSYLESWPSLVKRLLYETAIKVIPSQIVYGLQQLIMKAGYLSQQDAIFKREDFGDMKRKEEALRRIFGQTAIPAVFKKARTFSGYDRLLPTSVENGPPGLGNWDNSCYQNSVLQALASLPAFQHYVHRSLQLCQKYDVDGETTEALTSFLDRLADSSCQKSTLWTPAVLKSMDSWQQQDAQEYFSRIADAMEKEALQYTKMLCKEFSPGLSLIKLNELQAEKQDTSKITLSMSNKEFTQAILHNPMDGMQAQALECQTCGYSEGISLTQFNCLTLSLGLKGPCSVEELLDEYTDPEVIEGVECDQCTKEAHEGAAKPETDSPETKINGSLKDPKRPRVLRTKVKQLTLGRLPRDLVFHINRSIFDEYGNQRKNSSFINFGASLDILDKWCAAIEGDADADGEGTRASYQLKCIITHFGRHDNGHYVAYARRDKDWYCFNDEIVTKITEEEVLRRGNVFMLFYEMLDRTELAYADASEELPENTLLHEKRAEPEPQPEELVQTAGHMAGHPSDTLVIDNAHLQTQQRTAAATPVLHAV